MNEKIEKLKKQYHDIPIPDELDDIIAQALASHPRKKKSYIWPSAIAAAAVIFIMTVNVSPDAANAMVKIPVLGKVVEVITFDELKQEEKHSRIDVKTPSISGLQNKGLQTSLNEKYVKENKQLYEQFKQEMKTLQKGEKGNVAVSSGYDIMTDTDDLLVVHRYVEESRASTSSVNQYDTIDKKHEVLVTLPSLFKDKSYIKVISENIKQQMKDQMKHEEGKIYWLTEEDMDPFKQIDENQSFYITKDHKLRIVFDKYEVAPGYMGNIEFEIPTAVISNLLVGQRYIH
ncbi:RsiV family protein [Priestia megaterium]|uniref:RsiV family protein n=1 Tax=Priestia megaterium TaxID=1404 RepID=UPI00207ABAFF|nr:RsiV family protein [Priestia megaterium]USL41279.1 RsiV family protein [Priestia megaterium]